MQQGALATFVADRFGNQNSALSLNGGYTQIPGGIYFDTPQFTISVWVCPLSIVQPFSRLLEFSNGCHLDSLSLLLDQGTTSSNLLPKFEVFVNSTTHYKVSSNVRLLTGVWQMITISFDEAVLSFYINSTLVQTSGIVAYSPQSIMRTQNYAGNTSCPNSGYSSSYLDDIRFFNVSLIQKEIVDLFYDKSTNLYKNSTSNMTTTLMESTEAISNLSNFL